MAGRFLNTPPSSSSSAPQAQQPHPHMPHQPYPSSLSLGAYRDPPSQSNSPYSPDPSSSPVQGWGTHGAQGRNGNVNGHRGGSGYDQSPSHRSSHPLPQSYSPYENDRSPHEQGSTPSYIKGAGGPAGLGFFNGTSSGAGSPLSGGGTAGMDSSYMSAKTNIARPELAGRGDTYPLAPPDEPGPSNWASQKMAGLTLRAGGSASSRDREGGDLERQRSLRDGRDGRDGRERERQMETERVGGKGGREERDSFGDGRLGILPPEGTRSYNAIKLVGDGSFGTVWLCDWASPLSSKTELSAMQCGAGARAEWAGKRLVAVKRMKRVWQGGWKEASALGELVSLREIPSHPAIIPLYDAFLEPETKELYFVFECMEGNLYQLTKSRRGRPLAAGLVASIFHQVAGGLRHIHRSGYFHRDMKPENLLVTTTGLQDYMPVLDPESLMYDQLLRDAGKTPPERAMPRIEKDVAVIVKLADFGLARALESAPPYTEYVSTRWYRAPEVLLRNREYSAPVDMWAFGTIMAELVNLKALFPGQSEIDQVFRICETMGDPSREYGKDERGRQRGGGDWDRGLKMAKAVGFSFPKKVPVNFPDLFSPNTPLSLVDCIAGMLRYNPRLRLTSEECFEEPYYRLTLPHLKASTVLPRIPFSSGQPAVSELADILKDLERRRMQNDFGALQVTATRPLPPSHSTSNTDARPAFGHGDQSLDHSIKPMGRNLTTASALMDQLRDLDLPTQDLASYGHRRPPSESQQDSQRFSQGGPAAPPRNSQDRFLPPHMSTPTALASGPSQEHMDRYAAEQAVGQSRRVARTDDRLLAVAEDVEMVDARPVELPRPAEPRRKEAAVPEKKKKWGLGSVFGKTEAKSDPIPQSASLTGGSSLKRTQSGSQREATASPAPVAVVPLDPKKAKKEAEKQARELEKAKREAAERAQKERARAVMQKRSRLVEERKAAGTVGDVEWTSDLQRLDRSNEVGYQPHVRSSSASNATLVATRSVADVTKTAQSQSAVDLRQTYPVGPHLASKTSLASNRTNELSERALQQHSRGPSTASLRDGQAGPPPVRDPYDGDPARRAKARRLGYGGDHSTSSLELRLPNVSVMSIGTIDSDPGPARSPRQYPHSSAFGRAASATSLGVQSSRNRSNASLDRTLARDFHDRAMVTKPSSPGYGSTGSLSHYNTSSTSLSGPGTPHGLHPIGTAVANGVGLGRNGNLTLPSIGDWAMQSEGAGFIRGQGAEESAARYLHPTSTGHKVTLPPFAEIASVADSHLLSPKR